MLLPGSRLIEEVFTLDRGIRSLVGTQLDDIGFVSDLQAVVSVLNGASPADTARIHEMSRKRLEGLVTGAETKGREGVFKLRDDPRPAFDMIRTLLIGRVTEEVFRVRYQARIEGHGLRWDDHRAKRSEIDYTIGGGIPELDINVKNASEPFRIVEKLGFDPKDCVPLGIYKLLQARKTATARKQPFLFAYLIDWGASVKVQAAGRKTMSPEEITAAEVLLKASAPGQRRAQDVTIKAMVTRAETELLKIANVDADFMVVGWRKAFDILIDKFEERAPALTLPRAGWQGELGIFLQVSKELTPWQDVLGLLENKEFAEIGKRVAAGTL